MPNQKVHNNAVSAGLSILTLRVFVQVRNTFVLTDFLADYEETFTIALSANPAVVVPLLTINGWIVMHRKVTFDTEPFNQNWAAYRDGFGSATSNDYYWLGLDKVYRLIQLSSVTLRVEVQEQDVLIQCL